MTVDILLLTDNPSLFTKEINSLPQLYNEHLKREEDNMISKHLARQHISKQRPKLPKPAIKTLVTNSHNRSKHSVIHIVTISQI